MNYVFIIEYVRLEELAVIADDTKIGGGYLPAAGSVGIFNY